MIIIYPDKDIKIEEGKLYYTRNKKYIILIIQISNENMMYKNNTRYKYYNVNIYDTNMKMLAYNSIITFNRILDGKLEYYIPNLEYDTSYIGCVNINNYRKEFKLWRDMIRRCYDPTDSIFPYIGAMGTIVCDRWLCFEYFLYDLKYMDGWKENEKYFYRDAYIIDLYDIQKNINPYRRIYCPGLVKLKKFKNSDICKYINDSKNQLHNKYPRNIELTMNILKGVVDLHMIFAKRSGLNFTVCDAPVFFYNNIKNISQSPYNTYDYYNKKEMCIKI